MMTRLQPVMKLNRNVGNLICVIGFLVALFFWSGGALAQTAGGKQISRSNSNMEQIVLGGGCFWCMEAVFQSFRGIERVESGFAGGSLDNPSYDDVVQGHSGHAEVVRVTFNPSAISLKQVLTIFFHAHDPTTVNRQGNDVGSEYRSLILYFDERQRAVAEQVKDEISQAKVWSSESIVTEIKELKEFYRAEEYHQNYYQKNPSRPYCLLVVGPKVQKIKKQFSDLLKMSE